MSATNVVFLNILHGALTPGHAELEVPEPVMLPPEPQPLPQFVDNSAAVTAYHTAQAERDALFTMEVARKNLRNAALLTTLSIER